VFGIGTGRCGTVSLGKLLKGQPWSMVTHENRGDENNTGGFAPFWDPKPPLTIQGIAQARINFMRVSALSIPSPHCSVVKRTGAGGPIHWTVAALYTCLELGFVHRSGTKRRLGVWLALGSSWGHPRHPGKQRIDRGCLAL
jgi:hypothetical protein